MNPKAAEPQSQATAPHLELLGEQRELLLVGLLLLAQQRGLRPARNGSPQLRACPPGAQPGGRPGRAAARAPTPEPRASQWLHGGWGSALLFGNFALGGRGLGAQLPPLRLEGLVHLVHLPCRVRRVRLVRGEGRGAST